MRRLSALVLALPVVAALGGGCGEGGSSEPPPVASDELRAQIVEAAAPEGKIFHAEINVVSPGDSSGETVEVWIDGRNNRARSESPDRFEGRPAAGVFVDGESWSYDPWANRVDTYVFPGEELLKIPVQSPAVFALDYVRELATADEWRIVDEESKGRLLVFETKRTLKEADEDHLAGTVFVTALELDRNTLLPVRERRDIIQPTGEERAGWLLEFQRTEYLSPDQVPPDLFSPESLYELVGPQ